MKKDRPKFRPPAKRAPVKRAPRAQSNERPQRSASDRPSDQPPAKRPPLKRAFEARSNDKEQYRAGPRRPFKRASESSFTKRWDGAPTSKRPPFKRESQRPDQDRQGNRPPFKRTADVRSSSDRADDRPPSKRPPFKRAFERPEQDFREQKRPPFKRAASKRPVGPPVAKKRPIPISAPPESKGPKSLLKTLDRVLSKAGLGSRTEARSWIGGGRVRVNGLLVQSPDYWVNPKTDTVTLDDNPIDVVERRYVLLNKPKGYITTYKDPEGRKTVYDLLKGVDQFLGTVGRLDMDTSGLLLLTNDNDLAEAVTNPAYKLEKTYLVKAATLLSDEQLDRLRKGVDLDDGPTQPAEVIVVREVGKHTFVEITITEGRNRQVRRMLEAVASKVLKLVRVRLGPLTLEGLAMGSWRDLTEPEVARLISGKVRPKTKALISGPNLTEEADQIDEEDQ